MLSKRFTSFELNGDPCTSFIETVAGRFSRDSLLKVAGPDATWYADALKPKAGKFYLLIITNGAGERYGQNVNGDYYNEDARLYKGTNVPKGRPDSVMLDGGLKKYHKTYMEYGGVYRRHKNGTKKDPTTGDNYKKLGNVIAEHYNDNLHRGEVIVELDEKDWGDVLQKVLKGDPVAWSVGAGVPADLCSRCLNRAKSRNEYCDCLKYNLGKLLDDGTQVGAINDTTFYHDISEVGTNPAMKIAYTLLKVASADPRPNQYDLSNQGLWLPADMVKRMDVTSGNRYSLLEKLAKEEKRLGGMKKKDVKNLTDTFELPQGADEEAEAKCSDIPHEELISGLAKNKMLLPPKAFATIVIRRSTRTSPVLSGLDRWKDLVPEHVNGIFSKILESPELTEEVVNDGHYRPGMCPHCGHSQKLDGLKDLLSIEPEAVQRRVIIKVIRGPGENSEEKHEKTAAAYTEQENRLAFSAALEYAKYQLSFLAATGGTEFAGRAVALNQGK